MKRDLAYQIMLLFIIAGIAYLIISATQSNLARLGVDSSIDFLWKRAGFEIGQKLIPYSADSTIAHAFIVALLNTLLLATVSTLCASILGFIIGLARLSDNWLVARLATVYIEIFRNIPSLLQIFFWYFVVLRTLPHVDASYRFFDCIFLNNRGLFMPTIITESPWLWLATTLLIAGAITYFSTRWLQQKAEQSGNPMPMILPGILIFTGCLTVSAVLSDIQLQIPQPTRFGYSGGMVMMPEFISLVVGLSMYNATYIGEIVRSGFASIPKGQIEAADSLGLPRYLTVRLVLFPQALRVMIPPLSTVYLNLFKSTSLAAAIAYPEVVSVFVGTVNNLVGQPVFIMAVTMLVYACISLCIALFLNWYNRKISLSIA